MILNEIEIKNRERYLKEWDYGAKELWNDIEETCDGSRSYYYQIHPSGIGDQIILKYKNHSADITDYNCF